MVGAARRPGECPPAVRKRCPERGDIEGRADEPDLAEQVEQVEFHRDATRGDRRAESCPGDRSCEPGFDERGHLPQPDGDRAVAVVEPQPTQGVGRRDQGRRDGRTEGGHEPGDRPATMLEDGEERERQAGHEPDRAGVGVPEDEARQGQRDPVLARCAAGHHPVTGDEQGGEHEHVALEPESVRAAIGELVEKAEVLRAQGLLDRVRGGRVAHGGDVYDEAADTEHAHDAGERPHEPPRVVGTQRGDHRDRDQVEDVPVGVAEDIAPGGAGRQADETTPHRHGDAEQADGAEQPVGKRGEHLPAACGGEQGGDGDGGSERDGEQGNPQRRPIRHRDPAVLQEHELDEHERDEPTDRRPCDVRGRGGSMRCADVRHGCRGLGRRYRRRMLSRGSVSRRPVAHAACRRLDKSYLADTGECQ